MARLSMLLAGAAALALILIYRSCEPDAAPPPSQRTVFDMELEWRCDGGHTFRMHGQVDPAKCPICERPAYPIRTFLCDEHGAIVVAFKLRSTAEGGSEPVAVQFPGEGWKLPPEIETCPRCGKELRARDEDPLAGYERPRRPP